MTGISYEDSRKKLLKIQAEEQKENEETAQIQVLPPSSDN